MLNYKNNENVQEISLVHMMS